MRSYAQAPKGIQKSAIAGAESHAVRFDRRPATVDQTVAGSGRLLEPDLRGDMEQAFGHDFSRVRVHTGAMAERSARDVHADAYTMGHHIVFGAGHFAPQTQQGRQLIAHELTHVVQQARTPSPAIARQKSKARIQVEAAMASLKAKYGLAEVSEENGATWSASELAKVAAAFSRVAKEDQPLLKGLYLIRIDKLESKKIGEQTFPVAGTTYGTNTIRLTAGAFRGDASTILHEVGHLVNHKVAQAMLDKSKAKSDVDAAVKAAAQGTRSFSIQDPGATEYFAAIGALQTAAATLLNSSADDMNAKKALAAARERANEALPMAGTDATATALSEYHQRVERYADAVDEYVKEKGASNLTGFVALVKKHKFDRPGFAPFTRYVAANWPANPKEYFAEAFQTWRNYPKYMRDNMKPLFDWFEKGGHREVKTDLEILQETAPVIYELGREVKETFPLERLKELIPGR
jgi:hypothetical protein